MLVRGWEQLSNERELDAVEATDFCLPRRIQGNKAVFWIYSHLWVTFASVSVMRLTDEIIKIVQNVDIYGPLHHDPNQVISTRLSPSIDFTVVEEGPQKRLSRR